MPIMPRRMGKARKIAYKILGVPSNVASTRTPEERKINQRLNFEETARVR